MTAIACLCLCGRLSQPAAYAQKGGATLDGIVSPLALAIDGKLCARLDAVTGGGVHVEVIGNQLHSADGRTGIQNHLAGPPIPEDLTVVVRLPVGAALADWISEFWGFVAKSSHDVTVVTMGEGSRPASEIRYPASRIKSVGLNACDRASKSDMELTITFVPGGLPKETAPAASTTGTIPLSTPCPSSAWGLSIDGIDTSGVARIEPIVSSAAVQRDNAASDARQATVEGGPTSIAGVRVAIAAAKADAWRRWFDTFAITGANHQADQKTGRLVFRSSPGGPPLATVLLQEVGIAALAYEDRSSKNGSAPGLVATLYVNQMKLVSGAADRAQTTRGGPASRGPGEQENGKEKPSQNHADGTIDGSSVEGGAAQPASDNGQIGVTYTLGQGAEAVNFTLLGAEYSAARLLEGDLVYVPHVDEKHIVLHFALQNPNPQDTTVNWSTLKFAAVDSGDVSHTGTGRASTLFQKEGTAESTHAALRPGQKMALRTAILIPADASVPRLIVKRSDSATALQIGFRSGEVKPVPPPFADPRDATGCVAAREVVVPVGEYALLSNFDAKLLSATYSGPTSDERPPAGTRFLVANMVIRNGILQKQRLAGFVFETGVRTQDGDKPRMGRNPMLKAQRDMPVDTEIDPGEEVPVRILVPVPMELRAAELRMLEQTGCRTYVFRVP